MLGESDFGITICFSARRSWSPTVISCQELLEKGITLTNHLHFEDDIRILPVVYDANPAKDKTVWNDSLINSPKNPNLSGFVRREHEESLRRCRELMVCDDQKFEHLARFSRTHFGNRVLDCYEERKKFPTVGGGKSVYLSEEEEKELTRKRRETQWSGLREGQHDGGDSPVSNIVGNNNLPEVVSRGSQQPSRPSGSLANSNNNLISQGLRDQQQLPINTLSGSESDELEEAMDLELEKLFEEDELLTNKTPRWNNSK